MKARRSAATTDSPAPGGLRFSTSASVDQPAMGSGFTVGITRWLEAEPTASLGAILDQVAAMAVAEARDPSLGKAGSRTADHTERAPTSDGTGRKWAAFVGNSKYEHPSWAELGAVPGEVGALESALGGRGFETTAKAFDVDADGIRDAFMSIPTVGPNDQVVLYFGGHGERQGLVGVEDQGGKDENTYPSLEPTPTWDPGLDGLEVRATDGRDRLPLGDVKAIAGSLSSSGADVQVLLDACFSGTLIAPEGGGAFHELGMAGIGAARSASTDEAAARLHALAAGLAELRSALIALDAAVRQEAEPALAALREGIATDRASMQALEDAIAATSSRRSDLSIKEMFEEATAAESKELASIDAENAKREADKAKLAQAIAEAGAELEAELQRAVGEAAAADWPDVLTRWGKLDAAAVDALGVHLPGLPDRIHGWPDFQNAVAHVTTVLVVLQSAFAR